MLARRAAPGLSRFGRNESAHDGLAVQSGADGVKNGRGSYVSWEGGQIVSSEKPQKRWSLVVGGWSASEDEVFGESPHIPRPQDLQGAIAHRLGVPVSVVSQGRDPSIQLMSQGADDEGLGVPIRYVVTLDAGIPTVRVQAAVMEAVGRTRLHMMPGPLTLFAELFDDTGTEIVRRTVTLR